MSAVIKQQFKQMPFSCPILLCGGGQDYIGQATCGPCGNLAVLNEDLNMRHAGLDHYLLLFQKCIRTGKNARIHCVCGIYA